MGFYGNITNTARTQFQFDKVYANRKTMDEYADSDGVYAGRYVLVNYEEDGDSDYYIHAYKSLTSDGFCFGASYDGNEVTQFKWVETASEAVDKDLVFEGEIIAIPPDGLHNLINPNATKWEFWKVSGYVNKNNITYAKFIQFENLYAKNYSEDVDKYGTSRGYDSTVWQKTYQGGQDKYVMIAELNTVVPTFDIEADAPRMIPLLPHFDADSTNVYYKLHWSPTWGLRVKGANPNLKGPYLNDDGNDAGMGITVLTSDTTKYPSDETTTWYKTVYDGKETVTDYVFTVDSENKRGRWIPKDEGHRELNEQGLRESVVETPAAIYYNKDGFDPEQISYAYFEQEVTAEEYEPYIYYKKQNGKYIIADDLDFDSNQTYYSKIEDHIQLKPTGYSGHLYNQHDGSITDSLQEDIQELSIMLPAIGNTIAAVWDLVYGGEDVNKGSVRNLEIGWEDARAAIDRNGLRLVTDYDFNNQYLYQTKNVETIAGAINSVHDLLGMIITSGDHDTLINNLSSLNNHRIYYDQDTKTFNRKTIAYDYELIDNNDNDYYIFEAVDIDATEYEPGLYFYKSNNQYLMSSDEFDNNQTYYLRKLKEYVEYEQIDDLVNFDGSIYAYQDFNGTDQEEVDPVKLDYIRDSIYYKDKIYYRWDEIQVDSYPELSDAYRKNELYIIDSDGNYMLCQEETPRTDEIYYRLKPDNIKTLQQLGYEGVYIRGKYLYEDNGNYHIDTNEYVTPNRVYYILNTNKQTEVNGRIYSKTITYEKVEVLEEDYTKDTYYLYTGSGSNSPISNNDTDYELSSADFDNTKIYYIRNETLSLVNNDQYYQIDSSREFLLIQFHEHEFYYRDRQGNYKVLTRLAEVNNLIGENIDIVVLRNTSERRPGESNGGTYKLNPQDYLNEDISAMIRQDQFYEPGVYHYVSNNDSYSDYILDNYKTKTHDEDYVKIISVGEPVDLKFYNAYDFYQKNETTGEYTVITDDTKPEGIDIYTRHPVYIYDDAIHIYQRGTIWDFNSAYIPASIQLAYRTERPALEPLADFARNINTMHGMLLKIRAMLEYDNVDTRDIKTVQGALNTLNDKIAQFSTWKSGQLMMADNYGRLHGSDLINNQWIQLKANPSVVKPTFEVIHLYNPIEDTSHTTNLTTATGTNTIVETNTVIDEMGHVVGKHTETYQLPFGYGKIQGDSGTELAASGSNATIKFVGADNWIETETATDAGAQLLKITHNFTAGTNESSTVDLSTNTSASFVDVASIVDDKGHVIATNSKTIQFPKGYGLVAADSGNTQAADNTYATLTINGDNSWISTTAISGQKISVSHSDPVTAGATAIGPITGQTPAFGDDFNIPSLSIDAKGHVAVTGTTTVTIPSLSLITGETTINNEIITSLNYNAGQFTKTSITPSELSVSTQNALPSEVIAFWDAYDAWANTHVANEDGYIVVPVTENDFITNTYYILNPDENSDDKYILATEFNNEATYYSLFTDAQAVWLAENDPNNYYESTGGTRPATPISQTATLENMLYRIIQLENSIASL